MKKYTYHNPRPAVTTDCVVLSPEDGEMSVLLVQRRNEPFKGQWAIPGGFLNIDEDAPTGARRELKEETGIQVGQIFQLGAYSDPNRDPRDRVISIVFIAYLDKRQPPIAGDDAADAQWFSIKQLPELAFDHSKIIQDVIEMVNA